MKWPDLAASPAGLATAESLTTITLALTDGHGKFPDPGVLAGLCSATRSTPPSLASLSPRRSPGHWTGSRRHSCRWRRLKNQTPSAPSLNACAWRLDGKAAGATTARRKRTVFANVLGYAVERQVPPVSPLGQIQWKASEVAEAVDRPPDRQPRPARETPESRPRTRTARSAHGNVLRLPVLRRSALRAARS
jgi:hypothetical protein